MLRSAGVLLVVAGAVVTAAAPGSVPATFAYTLAFLAINVAAWMAVRRGPPGNRLPWALAAAAMTSWLVGDLVWHAQELAGHAGGVGMPDVLWLGGYPLIGAALAVMVGRRAPGRKMAGALDGLTLTVAAAMCLWRLVLAPDLAGSGISTQVVVGALYPLGDVVLLGSVLYLVLSPGRRGTATRLLVGGMALTLVCDLAFSVVPRFWPDINVERLDSLLLVANGLIVAAIRHRDRDELVTPLREPVETLHPARILFLGLALVTAPLMAITRGGLPLTEQALLIISTAVMVGFVLTRFTVAVREQARVQLLLAYQAAHDELTGLANRRTLIERLERDYRPAPDTMLLYLDLDRFKAINDEFGHAAGDTVLVEVAGRLRETVRVGDVVARLGGDEFAVLCHRLDGPGATRLADRLVDTLELPIPYDGRELSVSASVGVASAEQCRTGDELISRADEAMFSVKRHNRDAVA